jgi:hypothetical protein
LTQITDTGQATAPTRRRAGRRLAAAAATVLAAGGLAAVGASAGAAATRALSPADQALLDYAKCMRGKGVQIPDPVKGKDGKYAFPAISRSITGAAGVQEKARACATSSGALKSGSASGGTTGPGGFRGGGGGFGGVQTPAQQAAFKKFQDCLKAAGVTGLTPGTRPPTATSTTAGASSTGKSGTTNSGTVKDPKTGKAIAKPSIAGNGPDANGNDAQPGGGRRGGFFGGLANDPKAQAAFQKCRALLPAGGFGRGAGAPGSNG